MGRLPALRWAITAGGASSSSVPASLNTCTIYARHYAAEVIVTRGRMSECGTLITNPTGGGMVWSYTPNAGSMGNLTEQCDLSEGGYEAVVMDESAASAGQPQQVTGAQQLQTDLTALRHGC